jgi:hypothetical protein
MKTTIDIPEPLLKRAKIRAIEQGQSLKQLVLTALAHELEIPDKVAESPSSYWAHRQMNPDFKRLLESGRMKLTPGDQTIDDIIADIKGDPFL